MAGAKAKRGAPTHGDRAMLDNALGQIEKAFGEGSIMKLSDNTHTGGIPGIRTGALSLDLALGGNGFHVDELLKSLVQSPAVRRH